MSSPIVKIATSVAAAEPAASAAVIDRDAAARQDELVELTYVSDSRIPPAEVAAEIANIVAHASHSNHRHQITGALLFTGTRFVQTLEGAAADVDNLMAAIERDRRHANILIVDRHAVPARSFALWSLTYSGPSLFIATEVARVLDGVRRGVPPDVARLLRLMSEFSASPSLRPAA